MIVFVIYGILGFAWLSCCLLVIVQLHELLKLQKYTRIEAKISRTVRESWGGDTADREGGEYDLPVAEFSVAQQGNFAFVLREVEHLHYKPGETLPMAYPPNDPQQAIVFDSNKVWSTLALYILGWLLFSSLIIAWYCWTSSGFD